MQSQLFSFQLFAMRRSIEFWKALSDFRSYLVTHHYPPIVHNATDERVGAKGADYFVDSSFFVSILIHFREPNQNHYLGLVLSYVATFCREIQQSR